MQRGSQPGALHQEKREVTEGILNLNPGKYSKAIAAVVGQAVAFATLYYPGNHWVAVAIAVASVLGVYAVPNSPSKSEEPHLMP